ncbi:MAG TPA: putative sulfate exporter family transporter, partial [Orrella sp.]
MTTVAATSETVWRDRTSGVLFVALMAFAVFELAKWAPIRALSISPLVLGIVCGMLYGNLMRGTMPVEWGVGVNFSARRLLRIAVALYGLNISIQQIIDVGVPGIVVSLGVAVGVLAAGTWL